MKYLYIIIVLGIILSCSNDKMQYEYDPDDYLSFISPKKAYGGFHGKVKSYIDSTYIVNNEFGEIRIDSLLFNTKLDYDKHGNPIFHRGVWYEYSKDQIKEVRSPLIGTVFSSIIITTYDGKYPKERNWYTGEIVTHKEIWEYDRKNRITEYCQYNDGELGLRISVMYPDNRAVYKIYDYYETGQCKDYDYYIEYDKYGRISQIEKNEDDYSTITIDYYNKSNNKKSETYYLYRNYAIENKTIIHYDKYGNKTDLIRYDKSGRIIKNLTYQNTYDRKGNLIMQITYYSGSPMTLLKRVIEYY